MMTKRVGRFDDAIQPERFDVVSPYDERDWILPSPPELARRASRRSFAKALPILNQGTEGYCTAYALLATVFNAAVGGLKFKKYYSSFLANQVATRQLSFASFDWVKRLFRMDIWKAKGYNMRAALWNLSRSARRGDFALDIDGYYRVKAKTPEEFCDYIQHYGPMFCAVLFTERGSKDDGFEYDDMGGRLYGHAICITGFDRDRGVFTFVNSWGPSWGRRGFGEIKFEDFRIIAEAWHVKTQDIQFKVY